MLLYTMAFFTLSKILIKYQKIIDKTSTLLISAVIFAAAIVLDANRVLPEMRFLILSLYAGLILVFSLSAKVIKYKEKIKKPVTFLAGFSFLIYLNHEFSLSALQAVVYPLIPRQAWTVLATYLLLPLLLAAILITGGYLLKKLLPKVYDFLFNGR